MAFETGRIQHDMGPLRKMGDIYVGIRKNVKDSPTEASYTKIKFLTLKEIGVIGIISILIPIVQALLH